MMQVTKVWWDGEKLMAEPIDPASVYKEPEQPTTTENNGGKTGWPPGLLQDDSKGLSKWLSNQPDAKRRVREALADHTEQPLGMVAEDKPYRPLQDNGSKYFGAWDKAEQALNRMADNARELGLDYEPAQQAPVAWMEMVVANLVREGVNKHKARELAQHFYTSPPQRTWVGLTDEEITDIWAESSPYYHEDDFARAIEAKLRERNT